MKLKRAVQAWGSPAFRDELKAELETLGVNDLPLQRALSSGNYVLDQKPMAMINAVEEHDGAIVARVGLFFAGMDVGSCCVNDPTPVEPHDEYCELRLSIDPATGDTRVTLLDS